MRAACAGAREVALTENDSEHRGGDRAMIRTREGKALHHLYPQGVMGS